MANPNRYFYLEGNAPDSVLGLSGENGPKALKKDGTIQTAGLSEGQLVELERMAVTPIHPVNEGQPPVMQLLPAATTTTRKTRSAK